ncbi:ABC transporter transmembrane domain-containing protein [Telmatospirillum sp.]|uniref:ABC transporter ATP-binding protein n=1 Tax=Telmatospirillum sp. TaxID=2079197 RepID=UPI0028464ACF|nr:ABC transporter transmembrane domain-containing protein [Telmatospirillum sp.]MDR3439446.1 ABC transporter transmembrane domain-containing protein [Telmatospirillum sp.]
MTAERTNETKLALTDDRSLGLMRRLFTESVLPYRYHMIAAVICMGIVAGMTAASSWLLEPVVNKVFVQRDNSMLWLIGGSVFAVFAVKSLASYLQEILLATVGQHIISDTQNRLFHHIIHQDVSLFQTRASGTLVSHFTYDINAMRSAVSSAFVGIGRDALSVIFLVGLTFYQDWLLATVSLVAAPLSIYPLQRLGKRMRRVASQTQEKMGGLTTTLAQTFQGIRVIKAYGLEQFEETRVDRMVSSLCSLAINATRVEAAAQPIIDTFGGIAITAVIVYGGARVIEGATTPGAFFSFIASVLMAYQPLRSLSKVNVSLQTGLAAAYRIFSLLDEQPRLTDRADAVALPRVSGAVRFENVRFSYDGIDNALNGVSFEAPAGAITALVGPSGAGKSTVFSLIPRFYDPNDGAVVINGTDIRAVTIASLRDTMAVVSQEVVLFDDNIINNIRCGRLNATDDEVFAAARAAAAADFIDRLPDGYQTEVGEHGLRLSGGQRQRIAIARAILKDAPILLLDEATSALDTESERAIQTALATLMKGRTTIVIAHRLSTITDAKVIHVFDHGRVIETGNHDQLLARNGLYAHLHALQFAGQTADI